MINKLIGYLGYVALLLVVFTISNDLVFEHKVQVPWILFTVSEFTEFMTSVQMQFEMMVQMCNRRF